MKITRYLSFLLAAVLTLLPVAALAGGDDLAQEENVTVIDLAQMPAGEAGEPIEFASEAFIPEGIEKDIIGADNRVTIDNPSVYPYCAIANLHLKWKCGCSGTGTGFLIGADVMMSAAHIACCQYHNEPLSTMTAYFGYRSNKNYAYKYNDKFTFWYNSNFFASSGYVWNDWDYSYFKLNARVGDTVGWLGCAARTDENLEMTLVEVAGYRDGVLKTDWDYLHVVNDNVVSYENDTLPGNSGCPVFDSDYYVLAINTSANIQPNYGCRIRGSILEEMRRIGLID